MTASSNPLATVLIPAFNPGFELLVRAVRSGLEQTYDRTEVLVVDDGSTDGSIAQVKQHVLDPRFRVCRQPNAGLAAALNTGLTEAHGQIIIRLDADDVAEPRRVATQVAALTRQPDVGIVGGQIRRMVGAHPLSVSRFPLDHDSIMTGLKKRAHVLSHPAIAFRRDDALNIGGYWNNGVAEDWDFFLRMGEEHRLQNLAEVVLDYTFHDESINSRHLVDVRRNIRLAVANHERRVSGLQELSPLEHSRRLGLWQRLTCRREVAALNSYRTHLRVSVTSRRSASAFHLAMSSLLWPEQAWRRVSSRVSSKQPGVPNSRRR